MRVGLYLMLFIDLGLVFLLRWYGGNKQAAEKRVRRNYRPKDYWEFSPFLTPSNGEQEHHGFGASSIGGEQAGAMGQE